MKQEQQVFTVDEFIKIFRIGRNNAYERIKSGEIPSVRFGKSIRITKPVVDRMLACDAGDAGNGDASALDPVPFAVAKGVEP